MKNVALKLLKMCMFTRIKLTNGIVQSKNKSSDCECLGTLPNEKKNVAKSVCLEIAVHHHRDRACVHLRNTHIDDVPLLIR